MLGKIGLIIAVVVHPLAIERVKEKIRR
ncbi:hypothetical protein C5S53_00010 [Methanophagales archaeon]|nr:hypothetical protein C5S53_00010 [Methanophagales archaeon]